MYFSYQLCSFTFNSNSVFVPTGQTINKVQKLLVIGVLPAKGVKS